MAVQETKSPAAEHAAHPEVTSPAVSNADGVSGDSTHSAPLPEATDSVQTEPESRSDTDVAAEESAGPLPTGLHDSLARLEMNAIQVRLYLDAIEEKIIRMEPRIEELRNTQSAAEAEPRSDVKPLSPLRDESPDETVQPSINPDSAHFVERRRRDEKHAQERRRDEKPAQERRRPSLTSSERPKIGQPWAVPATHSPHRNALVATALACLIVLTVAVLRTGHRPTAVATSSSPVENARLPSDSKITPSSTLAQQPSSQDRPLQKFPNGTATKSSAAVALPLTPAEGSSTTLPSAAQSETASTTASQSGSPDDSTGLVSRNGSVASVSTTAESTPSNVPLAESGSRSHRTAGALSLGKAGVTQVSSGVMSGNLIYSRPPAPPKGLAHLFHIEGTVTMQAIISRTGRVEDLRVISGHRMLRGSARDAVMNWRYRPFYVNGSPVEVATIVSVDVRR